ncbi:uncharacterized protein DUF4403 [Novosphingobium sp. PhB165]|uniref:DUF4403 family protein n=1 Tax=Novosphingobium sp. PhB165 TaxID=2485105 RepID=UPI0010442445|nr:DUF4403 family protein [Novosphingobium sp. PhB165]TCM19604.1 uncharacterized protein DUF4403 [Novosphingobium sp. PhB165]
MKAKRVSAALGLLVLALAPAECHRKASGEGPPPRANDAIVIEPQASLLTVPVEADISPLGPALEREIPRTLWSIDQTGLDCLPSKRVKVAFVKIKTPKIKCDIVGDARRGALRFSGTGNEVVFTIPVVAQVQARDIGGVLKHETASARAEARARVRLDLTPDWRLRGKVEISYHWIDSPHLDFLGKRIDLSKPADQKLAPIVAGLEKQLSAELAKINVRPKIEQAWAAAFTSVELNKRNPPVWMRITPQELQYGGYTVNGHHLQLRLGLKALTETFVGERRDDPQPTALPPMRPLASEAGRIAFFIPVIADYRELEPVLMKALVKRQQRPFTVPGGGAVRAEFRKATIYGTTGGRIAVGIELSVEGTRGYLGKSSGTVWLTALPANAPDSRKVAFTALHVSGGIDMVGSDLLLSFANGPELSATLADALGQNFENDFQKLLGKIDRAIAEKRAGKLLIRAEVQDVHTGTIRAAGQGLYLPVRGSGVATVKVDE